ncbi:MAG: ComEC/Rec2 family competence protein [Chitinophagaceae bacterium]|nr:ComEC/Rec2 family competence protein [Chitinophagaceae bacterium]
MQPAGASILKRAPFIRLLLPLMAGIILQWHQQLPVLMIITVLVSAGIFSVALFLLPLFKKYQSGWLAGLFISLVFASFGALLVRTQDIRNNPDWLGNHYEPGQLMVLSLQEDPVQKKKSYKAVASVRWIKQGDTLKKITGDVIIYFQKDTVITNYKYGQQLIIQKELQPIKNSGNPGAFDYKRFCLFEDITHQVYLKSNEFVVLPDKDTRWFKEFLINTRQKVINILRRNIKGEKETGLAEALLIGYKDDLDKNLVQAYTRTGVVHVIAISGLHLGMIYLILVSLLKPLKKNKKSKWLVPIIIISFLWLFSLLAGAQPSVLRSALMFTCIVLGENLSRKTSIYNTLALSAFILLCINPFYLWDVGFQLSYAAVLSIVIFMQPVYKSIYIKNKLLDGFWKLNSVTISAQILTLPVSVYHFHQFPNLFLLSNFVTVPLSGLILYGEILLCALSFMPIAANAIGNILTVLIKLMNGYIEKIDAIPFSLWDGLQISLTQAALMVVIIAAASYWLFYKNKKAFTISCLGLMLFFLLHAMSYYHAKNQEKLIIYNVPGYPAIDFIKGQKAFFTGHEALLRDEFIHNFHLKPSRTYNRINEAMYDISQHHSNKFFEYGNKKILLVNSGIKNLDTTFRLPVDLMIISGKPYLDMDIILKAFSIRQIVMDGSVPAYAIERWKPFLDHQKIPYHSVAEKGAFEVNPN